MDTELNILTSTNSDEQKDTDGMYLNHVKEGDLNEMRGYIEHCVKQADGSRIDGDCDEKSAIDGTAYGVHIKLEPNHTNASVKDEPSNSDIEFNYADLQCGQRFNNKTNTFCDKKSCHVLSSCLENDVSIKVEPNIDNNAVKSEPSNCMSFQTGLKDAKQQFDQTLDYNSGTIREERSDYLLSICRDDLRIKDEQHKTRGRLVSGANEHCIKHYKHTNRSKMGDDCDEESTMDGCVYGVHIKLEPNHGNKIMQINSSNCMGCETGLDNAAIEFAHTSANIADTCKERTSCRLSVYNNDFDLHVKDEHSQSRELLGNGQTTSQGTFSAMQATDEAIERQYNYAVITNEECMETGKQQTRITQTDEERMETGKQQTRITQTNEERMQTEKQQTKINQTNEERMEAGKQQTRITQTDEERMETGKQQTRITQTNEERMQTEKQQTKINQTNEERMEAGKQQTRITQTDEERMETGKQQTRITQSNKERVETDVRPVSQTQITQPNKDRYTFKCDFCEFKTQCRGDVRPHKNEHHPSFPYECEFCGFTTIHIGSFRRHRMRHTGERPYKCDLCDYGSIYLHRLKEHIKRKHTWKMYICDICGYTTYRPLTFKRHKEKHT